MQIQIILKGMGRLFLTSLLAIAAQTFMPEASQAQNSSWVPCARENRYCQLPSDQMYIVRYGAQGRYYYSQEYSGTRCDNQNFRDPNVGVVKSCDYLLYGSPRRPTPPQGTWTFCSSENGYCNIPGNRRATVAYGANGRFNYIDVGRNEGGIYCKNAIFNDPIQGTFKSCFVQLR